MSHSKQSFFHITPIDFPLKVYVLALDPPKDLHVLLPVLSSKMSLCASLGSSDFTSDLKSPKVHHASLKTTNFGFWSMVTVGLTETSHHYLKPLLSPIPIKFLATTVVDALKWNHLWSDGRYFGHQLWLPELHSTTCSGLGNLSTISGHHLCARRLQKPLG